MDLLGSGSSCFLKVASGGSPPYFFMVASRGGVSLIVASSFFPAPRVRNHNGFSIFWCPGVVCQNCSGFSCRRVGSEFLLSGLISWPGGCDWLISGVVIMVFDKVTAFVTAPS